jgi:hypothetical protein
MGGDPPLAIIDVEGRDLGFASGAEADEGRSGFETRAVDDDGRRDRNVRPASARLVLGTYDCPESTAGGGPGVVFELDGYTVGPGGLFDRHGCCAAASEMERDLRRTKGVSEGGEASMKRR